MCVFKNEDVGRGYLFVVPIVNAIIEHEDIFPC